MLVLCWPVVVWIVKYLERIPKRISLCALYMFWPFMRNQQNPFLLGFWKWQWIHQLYQPKSFTHFVCFSAFSLIWLLSTDLLCSSIFSLFYLHFFLLVWPPCETNLNTKETQPYIKYITNYIWPNSHFLLPTVSFLSKLSSKGHMVCSFPSHTHTLFGTFPLTILQATLLICMWDLTLINMQWFYHSRSIFFSELRGFICNNIVYNEVKHWSLTSWTSLQKIILCDRWFLPWWLMTFYRVLYLLINL